jgi:hypothetical protein
MGKRVVIVAVVGSGTRWQAIFPALALGAS